MPYYLGSLIAGSAPLLALRTVQLRVIPLHGFSASESGVEQMLRCSLYQKVRRTWKHKRMWPPIHGCSMPVVTKGNGVSNKCDRDQDEEDDEDGDM